MTQNVTTKSDGMWTFQQATPTNILTVTLPANVSAVGFDFIAGDPVTVTLSSGQSSQSFSIGTSPFPNFSFAGFTADGPISAIQIASVGGADLDNFTTGVIEVPIDIKPGEFPNPINLNSRGNIPVAILSTSDFNAPTTVRMSSLTFGRTGDEQSLTRCNTEDVNADGLPDLICQFDSQTAAFQAGDTKGILKGATIEGTPFQGEDAVRIIP